MKYDFKAVEAKWQKVWQDEHTFHAEIDHSKPKPFLYEKRKKSADKSGPSVIKGTLPDHLKGVYHIRGYLWQFACYFFENGLEFLFRIRYNTL